MPGLVARPAEDRDVGRIKPPARVHADRYDVVAVLAWRHSLLGQTILAQRVLCPESLAHLLPSAVIACLRGRHLPRWLAALIALAIHHLATSPTEPHAHCVVVTVTEVLLPASDSTARR